MSVRKILCPIDFSPGSTAALRVAVQIAKEHDSELVLAHVWYLAPTSAGGSIYPQTVIQEIAKDAQQGIDQAVAQARSLGATKVTGVVLTGSPAGAVTDLLTTDRAFDLVVAGTHGRTGIARILLGSIVENIVRHAPCSVLVIRPTTPATPFHHVACAIDDSEPSQIALGLAPLLVHPEGEITLINVIDIPLAYYGEKSMTEVVADLDQRSNQLLTESAIKLHATTAVPITTSSTSGRPGARLIAEIDKDPSIDLVVIGSHGRTGLRRVLLGSVAEKVARHVHCPVLIARQRPPVL